MRTSFQYCFAHTYMNHLNMIIIRYHNLAIIIFVISALLTINVNYIIKVIVVHVSLNQIIVTS